MKFLVLFLAVLYVAMMVTAENPADPNDLSDVPEVVENIDGSVVSLLTLKIDEVFLTKKYFFSQISGSLWIAVDVFQHP